jgi:hypothetical protein
MTDETKPERSTLWSKFRAAYRVGGRKEWVTADAFADWAEADYLKATGTELPQSDGPTPEEYRLMRVVTKLEAQLKENRDAQEARARAAENQVERLEQQLKERHHELAQALDRNKDLETNMNRKINEAALSALERIYEKGSAGLRWAVHDFSPTAAERVVDGLVERLKRMRDVLEGR